MKKRVIDGLLRVGSPNPEECAMTVFVSRYRRAYVRKRSIRQMVLIILGILVVIAILGIAGTYDRYDEERDRELTREIRAYAAARAKDAAAVAIIEGEPQHVPMEGWQ